MARVLYFATLVKELGKESEEIEIPDSGVTAGALLARLRTRGGAWTLRLKQDLVRVTVNKQFAESGTMIANGDEVAIIPARL